MRELHLICNAHLDPVWLWQWEEGAAEALSTFRIAADFCDEYDGYVFNHNEVVLYEWVEEYDPALFERIRRHVKNGRWHIMGGWYLQPDCNMPGGESFVRQALTGRRYFAEKFDARPTTAINFDPFGHTRGLVQILAKCGFDSYIFGRPFADDLELPAEEFTWVGFDGSTVVAHRPFGHYLTQKGEAVRKIERVVAERSEVEIALVLWGIGNHGGGASREDLEAIGELSRKMKADAKPTSVLHSSPEAYFAARSRQAGGGPGEAPLADVLDLPRFARSLNPWAPGCYTSQIRIKQTHRALEDELFAAEKMASQAALRGMLVYPKAELDEALRDLMFSQFHDILPGSAIPAAEEASLVRLDHGREIVSRVRARAFFAMTRGEPEPAEGDIPIIAYNPHPFPVERTFEVEFQPSAQNWSGTFTSYRVRQVTGGGEEVPVQFEKEASTIEVDWRKRMVFRARLAPAALSRFDCTPVELPERPAMQSGPDAKGRFVVANPGYRAVIGGDTGLLESYEVDGEETLAAPGPVPLVLRDSDNAWESRGRSFRDVAGRFELADPARAAEIAGVRAAELAPVRVIEDGPVRTVVEAILAYGSSYLVMTYLLPRDGTEIGITARVLWSQKRAMLKLALPLARDLAKPPRLAGQTAFGVDDLVTNGEEAVAQRWVAVTPADGAAASGRAFTVINDGTYGCSMEANELRLTLLRSPAYSGLPTKSEDAPIPQDRFVPRIDQGERLFSFHLNAGPAAERLAAVDREATAHGERPMLLMVYPSPDDDDGRPGSAARAPAMTVGPVVQMPAFKAAEDGDGYVVRLYEPTGTARSVRVRIAAMGIDETVQLSGFEAATFRVRDGSRTKTKLEPVNMVEE